MSEITPISVPGAIEYVPLEPKTELLGVLTPDDVANFKRDIILKAQGVAVQISEDTPPIPAALAFAAAYDVATEAVLRRENGALILLFDHEAVKPLRPDQVDESIWQEMVKEKEKVVALEAPARELAIDLIKLWRRAGEENGFIACVKFFIELLLKELQPCLALHLRGAVPSLPLLAAIYVARPYGKTIKYTDDAGRNVILFS
jgi:hypothetical protein